MLVSGCAVIPWIFTTRIDDVFYLPKLISMWVLLAVVLWLMLLGVLRGKIGRLRWIALIDVPIAAFVLLNLGALAFSVDKHQSLFGERLQHQGVLTTLLYLAFFYVARLLVTEGRLLLGLFASIAVGAVGVSLYAAVQRLGLDPIWNGFLPSGRFFSTIGQSNALAAYLVLAIPVTLALAFAWRRWELRGIATCGAVLMAVALLLTYSRVGYLALGVVVLVMLCSPWRRVGLSRRARAAVLMAIVVLVVVGAAWAPTRSLVTGAWSRAWSVSTTTHDVSIGNHVDQWRVADRIIADHPLFGTGPETFPEVFPSYSRLVLPASSVHYFDQFRVESPHDQALAIASGAGIPTAMAYLVGLGGIATVLTRAVRRSCDRVMRIALVSVIAAAVGHVVTDSFMSAEVTGSWLFWVLMGAGVAVASGLDEARIKSVPSVPTAGSLDTLV